MVSDMLWLAKSDHGLMTLQRSQVDVQQQAQQLLEFFELLADEKQVQLQLHVSPNTRCLVEGDRDMLRRALSNLLSNAIRHADVGTEVQLTMSTEPPAWLTHHPAQAMLWLSVKNQGAAIPTNLQSRVFDRFFRADPARQRHSDGAGLGLAIVKSTAQLHGGLVALQSDEQGTEFVLALPNP